MRQKRSSDVTEVGNNPPRLAGRAGFEPATFQRAVNLVDRTERSTGLSYHPRPVGPFLNQQTPIRQLSVGQRFIIRSALAAYRRIGERSPATAGLLLVSRRRRNRTAPRSLMRAKRGLQSRGNQPRAAMFFTCENRRLSVLSPSMWFFFSYGWIRDYRRYLGHPLAPH